MNEQEACLTLRPALGTDAAAVASCVCEAYIHYIERIGKQPGPMLEDYCSVIANSLVYVAVLEQRLVGVIVLKVMPEGLYVDNVAVRPQVKGTGADRALLELAERQARERGYTSICLATHERMVENRALYQKIGYVEYDRRVVDGYPRVFFSKLLGEKEARALPA